jgi:AdoMet-dependent heme synthase
MKTRFECAVPGSQRRKAEGGGARGYGHGHPGGEAVADTPLNKMAGINSGRGFVFVSRTGEIYPSGFLPISSGNVRRDSLVDVYQNGALFQVLRDSSCLKGKCGFCQYRNLCGGSRSRAYALTGDYLAEEARCPHHPEPVQPAG